MVRTKRRRKLAARIRDLPLLPEAAREHWGIEFVSDHLSACQRLRILAAVDHFTRECLSVEAGLHLHSKSVTRAVHADPAECGKP